LGLLPFVDPRIIGRIPGIGGTGQFIGKVHLVEISIDSMMMRGNNNNNNNFSLPGSFFVVNNSLHDCIIGMDFLHRFNCKVDFAMGTMHVTFRNVTNIVRVDTIADRQLEEALEVSGRREKRETILVSLC